MTTKFNIEIPMDARGQRTTSTPITEAPSTEWVTPVYILNGEDIKADLSTANINVTFPDLQQVEDNSLGEKIDELNAMLDLLTKRRAREPFNGSVTMSKDFTSEMHGLVIANDAPVNGANLSFTVNGFTFIVAPGEVWDDYLDPFTHVSVTTTVPFRAYGKG